MLGFCICIQCMPAWIFLNNLLCNLDYSKGFGGKYGVQKDHVDKVPISNANLVQFMFCHVRSHCHLKLVKLSFPFVFLFPFRALLAGITKEKRKSMRRKKVIGSDL